MMALTLLAAMPIDFATRLGLFTIVILVHNAFAAVQDVAIDALAVSSLPPDERGLANGLMFAGSYVGSGIGGAGVLFLAPWVPWFGLTFLFVAAAILSITALVTIPLRERTVPASPREADGDRRFARAAGEVRTYAITALRAMLGGRAAFAGVVFALLPAGAFALGLSLSTTLAVDLRMSESRIAWLSVASTVLAAGGCVAGGALSDRIGRRRALAIYAVLTAVPTAALGLYLLSRGWSAPPSPGMSIALPVGPDLVVAFVVASLAFSLAQGLIYGTRTALFMDLCEPAVAATQFTAYMSLLNVVNAYSAWWQGKAIERLGYPKTLLLDAALGVVSVAVLPLTLRERVRPAAEAAIDHGPPPPFATRAG